MYTYMHTVVGASNQNNDKRATALGEAGVVDCIILAMKGHVDSITLLREVDMCVCVYVCI